MGGINCIIVGLLALLINGVIEVQAKCSRAPLEGERRSWIAYACVQGDFADVYEVPNEAEWIEFTVSRINNIPADAFSRFPNLRRLSFYNCDLRNLNPDAFRGLDNLEWLLMSNTEIGIARASLFRHLQNLRRLTLDGAGLVYIEPEVFHNFRRLETLSLRNNDLDCLPIHALHALENLKTVQIGRNPWLCDCKNSLSRFFDSRRIFHGPEETCVMPNNVTRNVCPVEVYDCMTPLDPIFYPALPAPQANFTQIVKHQHGRFEWRESSAMGIANLDRLPDETSWVQILDVEIVKIPRYAFFRFGNTLRSIEMDNCGIREIEREAFAGLHKLERLILVGNGLTTIGHDWFRDLGRLHQLILRRNSIENFEKYALVHLRELRTLDISENRLSCLHENYLRGLVTLERLEIGGNPWICGCRMDLERYLTRMNIGFSSSSRRCEDRAPSINDEGYKFTWNSSRAGTIRWSWASKTHWPPVPRPTLPSNWPPTLPPTTTTPKIIYTPPTRPPRIGGCRIISRSGQATTCICTRASISDLINVPANVETIKFSNSVISEINNDAFSKFGPHLRNLEFRECSIQRIESCAFYGLWWLHTLVIRGNYLEVVESMWFEQMTNLRTLDLAHNRIMRIENGVFDRVPHLVRLDVSDNKMNCISSEHIEALQNLREMEVTGNPWTCLCARKLVQIMKEKRIRCNCDPNVLLQSDEGGWGCDYDPRDKHPTSPTRPVPPSWPTTRPTPPSTYPPQTTAVTPTMPSGPPTGTCIRSRNDIDGGPWYNCADGDILVLQHIPSYVTKIEIRDSYIPNLPAMVFKRFENLTDLVMINCTLTDIDRRAFVGLTRLERLTLRHNRFTTVRNGWFSDTKNIVWIDVSDNELSDIEIDCFVGLNRLEYLNFEGNAFRCIYTSCLTGIPRLATVEFGRNNRQLSWRCWEELQEYLMVRGINYTNYNCPRNGKDVVKNWLKDEKSQAQKSTSGTTDSASFYCGKVLALSFIVVMRFYV